MLLPEWSYPSPGLLLTSILLAHILDYAYPYHRGILLSIHPVHTVFMAAKRLAPPYSSRLRGAVAWLIVTLAHLGLYAGLLYAAYMLSPWAWVIASAWVLKNSFSLRLLLDSVTEVAYHLESGRLDEARRVAQGLVRRNVYVLGPGHVASAALESLAESLVDGYTSPLFYAVLFGPLGALFQRIV
ncbi:MAG: CobD/CbiB family cobalamin biosynthesis protein, partial [Pyrodictiaceae archaeon]